MDLIQELSSSARVALLAKLFYKARNKERELYFVCIVLRWLVGCEQLVWFGIYVSVGSLSRETGNNTFHIINSKRDARHRCFLR